MFASLMPDLLGVMDRACLQAQPLRRLLESGAALCRGDTGAGVPVGHPPMPERREVRDGGGGAPFVVRRHHIAARTRDLDTRDSRRFDRLDKVRVIQCADDQAVQLPVRDRRKQRLLVRSRQ